MSIGIYDMDQATYTMVPFNLEAMKISSYYKKRGEIVILSPSFLPERHQKVFLRKDYDDGNYPIDLTKHSNVEYGGLAFSNGVYQPLPLEIERCKPDTLLYQKAEQSYLNYSGFRTVEKKKIFQNLMEAEHCRISLDGKTIWEDYPKQFKFLPSARHLIFHDVNLNQIEGGFEEVKKILSNARTDGWATRVGMKFPIVCDNGQDLLNWCSLKPNRIFYSLRYNGIIPNDAFIEFVGRNKEQSIYKQLEYYVAGPWYDQNDFVMNKLPIIFRQVIISRSFKVFFSLKYEEGYFKDKRWEKVIDLINYYHNSLGTLPTTVYINKIPNDTLYDFAKGIPELPPFYYKGKAMSKQEVREVFAFVRENNYNLFKDFYECNFKSLEGGQYDKH